MSNWIPVTQALPKDGAEVLISALDSWVTQVYWYADSKTFVHEEGLSWDLTEVLAWQPLPEPYDFEKEANIADRKDEEEW